MKTFYIFRSIFLILTVIIEFTVCKVKKINSYDYEEAKSNIFIFLVYAFLPALFAPDLFGITSKIWNHRLINFPQAGLWVHALSFILVDFAFYWTHRYNHACALGWSSHFVHHSPTKINLTAGSRIGILRNYSLIWVFHLPIIYLGIHPKIVAFSYLLNFFYQIPIHTQVVGRLGFLEKLLVTPSHHRVHHSSDPEFFNSNFSGVFIIFDKIFGTFRDESEVKVNEYGFERYMKQNYFDQTFYIWKVIFKSFLNEKNLFKKIFILFRRPDKIKNY